MLRKPALRIAKPLVAIVAERNTTTLILNNMTKKTYQIQIALRGSKPKIWRRIVVPSDLLLSDFHKIIQTTMGWTNSHLHQFIKNRTFYTLKMAGDDFWGEMNNVDYSKMKRERLERFSFSNSYCYNTY